MHIKSLRWLSCASTLYDEIGKKKNLFILCFCLNLLYACMWIMIYYIHIVIELCTLFSDNEDPMVRGLALRSLSSLRMESILEYIQQPIQKSLTDISPYVRKNGVLAIVKVRFISFQFYYWFCSKSFQSFSIKASKKIIYLSFNFDLYSVEIFESFANRDERVHSSVIPNARRCRR